MPRKYTNILIEQAENYILDWEKLARACLEYMSEDDVKDMGDANGFLDIYLGDDFLDN